MSTDEMLDARLDKYSKMGAFDEVTTEK